MCTTAAVKSGPYISEADTVKELAFLLDIDPIMNDGFIGDPIDNACLCGVDFDKTADLAGMQCRDATPEDFEDFGIAKVIFLEKP